jgi:hypothetical protein
VAVGRRTPQQGPADLVFQSDPLADQLLASDDQRSDSVCRQGLLKKPVRARCARPHASLRSVFKPRCCPNAPARKLLRSIHEGARDLARDIVKTEAYQTSRCQRKKCD